MNAWARSLTTQLAFLAGTWVTVGMVIVWLVVTAIVAKEAQRGFDARLVSLADALAAAMVLHNGHAILVRPVSEPRFDQPLSGVYFQIESPDGSVRPSRSLWDTELPPGTFGHADVLMTDLPGPRGQHLRLAERDIVPEGETGTVHILVAMATDEMETGTLRTRQVLGAGFGALGAGVVGAVVLQVWAGLRRLRRLSGVVAELRTGGDVAMLKDVPNEVRPLVQEIEALVRQNRATVERTRGHVGNLAHALRTRLSIMRNALATGDTATLGRELTEADRLVQHHLTRARAAALSGTAASDVAVAAVARDIGGALRQLFADRRLDIAVTGDPDLLVRCEREDLAEMLGNLMENACKWGRSRVAVNVWAAGESVIATVSDDGPGLPESQPAPVLDRGVRLDETVPGSGLGLAIVADLATLYGGRLSLVSPGPDGGLAAHLALPRGARSRKVAHF
jgi:signal transduction histidine kinase